MILSGTSKIIKTAFSTKQDSIQTRYASYKKNSHAVIDRLSLLFELN